MSTVQNKLTAHRFYNEVINQRKLYLIDELATANFVDHNPEPGQESGINGVKAMFRGFLEAFPDMTMTVEHTVAEGDLVGCRCVMRGTHLGSFNGLSATGRTLEVRGFDWSRYENGKIVERWGLFDNATMMQQLGAIPGPSTEDYKGLTKKYFETIDSTKGDISSLRGELLHPNFKATFSGQPNELDFTATQDLMRTFWAAFPDIQHEIKSQICEGNVVYSRMRVTATHRGAFAGVQPTNNSVAIEVFTSHTWTDGLLSQAWANLDIVSLLTQIGAIKN